VSTFEKDRLGGYVEVKDRIALFYAAHPDGRLVTDAASMSLDPDGIVRVWCKALAYRTVDDPHPGVGWSYLAVPGLTPYTKGSEIENAETSAWGRAIGSLGIGIDKSIASANEIRTKATAEEKVERGDDGSLIGVIEVGDKVSSDFMERRTPDGAAVGFRLRGDKGGILVECRGPLAEQMYGHKAEAVGKRVTVWGTVGDRSFDAKDGRKVTYQAMAATRIRLPGIGDLPVPVGPVATDDLTEAESVALWELAGVEP
jgi:hypothetical protein